MNYYEQRLFEIGCEITALQQHPQAMDTIKQLEQERQHILQQLKYME